MADGFTIQAVGADAAQRELMARASRLLDLSPALRPVAAEIEKTTDDAFRDSKSPFGEPFPPLALSTIKARIRKLPGARARTRAGKLTDKAKRIRGAATVSEFGIGPQAIKQLVDTGRARASQHAVVVGKNSIEWSAVPYLQPHVTGSLTVPNRPPKRNVSVFQLVGGQLVPHPRINALIVSNVSRYVQTGRV